jgi:hypothetical protein
MDEYCEALVGTAIMTQKPQWQIPSKDNLLLSWLVATFGKPIPKDSHIDGVVVRLRKLLLGNNPK